MISAQQFPLLSFEQANPYMKGNSAAMELLQKALQTAYAPKYHEEELLKQHLANQLSKVTLPYAEPMAKAELEGKLASNAMSPLERQIKEAQLQSALFGLQHPYAHATGVAGQLEYLQHLKELEGQGEQPSGQQFSGPEAQQMQQIASSMQGQNQPQAQTGQLPQLPLSANQVDRTQQLMQALQQAGGRNVSLQQIGTQAPQAHPLSEILENSLRQQAEGQNARSEYLQARTKAMAWASLPPQMKQWQLAKAADLGYPYEEASALFTNGATLEQLAKAKGREAKEAVPRYPATQANITQQQRSTMALAGLDAIDPILSEAIAPYSRRFAGYSLPQTLDSLKGTNVDKQAKYLAAKALQPEIAALRIKAAQGQVGITAIHDMIASSQNRIKNLESTVSPEVYTKMNKYINQWLNKLNKAEKEELYGGGKEAKEPTVADALTHIFGGQE